jgi:hypothetical protein
MDPSRLLTESENQRCSQTSTTSMTSTCPPRLLLASSTHAPPVQTTKRTSPSIISMKGTLIAADRERERSVEPTAIPGPVKGYRQSTRRIDLL